MDPATLNAVLRLSLRITRDFDMACDFARSNGVQHLLNLKESSSFPGALPLVTLLLRHVVEDYNTLKHTVDRAVAVASNNGVPNMFCGVGQNSLGAKELHYLLRVLGPIACRNPELYNESTMKILRIVLPNSRRGQVEEVIPPNSAQVIKVPQELKALGLSGIVPAHQTMESFINLLLNSLVERHINDLETGSSSSETSAANVPNKSEEKRKSSSTETKSHMSVTPQSTLVRRLTGEHIDEEDMVNSE